MTWETIRTTPEEIVARIGNIANRSDIKETQEIQAMEIRLYAANEMHKIAIGIMEMSKLDKANIAEKFLTESIAAILINRGNEIQEGK